MFMAYVGGGRYVSGYKARGKTRLGQSGGTWIVCILFLSTWDRGVVMVILRWLKENSRGRVRERLDNERGHCDYGAKLLIVGGGRTLYIAIYQVGSSPTGALFLMGGHWTMNPPTR